MKIEETRWGWRNIVRGDKVYHDAYVAEVKLYLSLDEVKECHVVIN